MHSDWSKGVNLYWMSKRMNKLKKCLHEINETI